MKRFIGREFILKAEIIMDWNYFRGEMRSELYLNQILQIQAAYDMYCPVASSVNCFS